MKFAETDSNRQTRNTSVLDDYRWNAESDRADERLENIDYLVQFLNEKLEMLPDDGYRWSLEEGLRDALNLLRRVETAQALRRLSMLPFVLVPGVVSGNEKLGLVNYLREAQKAFVLGSDFGSLALLRSLLEITLRHYCQGSRSNLSVLLDTAELPPGVSKMELERLKKRADWLVHGSDYSQLRKLLKEKHDFETMMIKWFVAIRRLIECAPN